MEFFHGLFFQMRVFFMSSYVVVVVGTLVGGLVNLYCISR